MAVLTHLTASKLIGFYTKNKLQLQPGTDVHEGDVVLCSVAQNWGDPCDMGVVKRVAEKGEKFKLCAGHEDGEFGEVFVQTYSKQRLPRKKLESKLCHHYYV